jgi:hypothetical protein
MSGQQPQLDDVASRGGSLGDHVRQLFHVVEKLLAWIW